MTEKLYYTDAFWREFEATALSCERVGDHFEIVLDRTAFFPEGGGQAGDSGKIGEAEIYDTKECGGEIRHWSKTAVNCGTSLSCRLDFEKRFERMQCHSGEHIVSGLFHKLYGLNNVGFHLGDDDVTIDLDGIPGETDIRKIEWLANETVAKNIPIRAFFPSKEEASAIEYRSKLEIAKGLRLVEIPGADICACCAPHVGYTGQIGQIKLLDYAKYKGGLRLYMLAGVRALRDYQEKYASVLKISNLLSAKQREVAEAVERLLLECGKRKKNETALRRALVGARLASLEPSDKNLVLFEPLCDPAALRALADGAAEKCRLCAAFSGSDKDGYSYVVASRTEDLRAQARALNDALCGRGGGSPQMICGSVHTTRQKIEEYFR